MPPLYPAGMTTLTNGWEVTLSKLHIIRRLFVFEAIWNCGPPTRAPGEAHNYSRLFILIIIILSPIHKKLYLADNISLYFFFPSGMLIVEHALEMDPTA